MPGPVSVIPGGSCPGPGRPASSSGRLGCSRRAAAAVGWTLGLGTLECWKLERPVSSHKNKQMKSLVPVSGPSEHFTSGTCGIVDITGYVFCFSSFYFAGLASSPRQKTYLHLSPQSRLFAGTLYVVMALPSDTNPCMSLPVSVPGPRPTLLRAGGAWVLAAACLGLRAGICPGARPASSGPEGCLF